MSERRRNEEPELRLLVEDFFSSRPVTPPGVSPVIPIDGPAPRFLLEEYDAKLSEGAAHAGPERKAVIDLASQSA